MDGLRTAQITLCRANSGLVAITALCRKPSATTIPTNWSRAVSTAAPRRTKPADAAHPRRLGLPATSRAGAAAPSLLAFPSSVTSSSSSSSSCPRRHRCFSQTAAAHKKGGGASNKKNKGSSAEDTGKAHGAAAAANPADLYDFSDVEESWARLAERADEKLRSLRQGGRFNPDSIGRIPVRADSAAAAAAAATAATVPLSEVALVDAKQGRVVQITLLGEEYKRAVVSAIQSSGQFNQQPQQDPDDPMLLTLKVEVEPLEGQVRLAREACHAWREGVRKVSGARSKRHAAWKKDGTVQADDYVKLGKKLQALQDKRMAEVDQAEKRAVDALKKSHGSAF